MTPLVVDLDEYIKNTNALLYACVEVIDFLEQSEGDSSISEAFEVAEDLAQKLRLDPPPVYLDFVELNVWVYAFNPNQSIGATEALSKAPLDKCHFSAAKLPEERNEGLEHLREWGGQLCDLPQTRTLACGARLFVPVQSCRRTQCRTQLGYAESALREAVKIVAKLDLRLRDGTNASELVQLYREYRKEYGTEQGFPEYLHRMYVQVEGREVSNTTSANTQKSGKKRGRRPENLNDCKVAASWGEGLWSSWADLFANPPDGRNWIELGYKSSYDLELAYDRHRKSLERKKKKNGNVV